MLGPLGGLHPPLRLTKLISPTAGMLEKDVEPLLHGFPAPMVENVFGLERLVDRQRYRVVRVRHAQILAPARRRTATPISSSSSASACSMMMQAHRHTRQLVHIVIHIDVVVIIIVVPLCCPGWPPPHPADRSTGTAIGSGFYASSVSAHACGAVRTRAPACPAETGAET
uniref:Uncharacterized protein n=1 Tax=Anopheles coluzzii TaxID=1518534 RepID=A0A8W7P0B0_ANOCL